jgi:hypothetical protein
MHGRNVPDFGVGPATAQPNAADCARVNWKLDIAVNLERENSLLGEGEMAGVFVQLPIIGSWNEPPLLRELRWLRKIVLIAPRLNIQCSFGPMNAGCSTRG